MNYAIQHSYNKNKEAKMEKSEIQESKRRLKTLRNEMAGIGQVMRGSVVVIGTRNKQPYFSLNKDKKTRLIYLGRKREPTARAYSANYKRLLEIIDEMTLINMELLKNEPPE